MSDLFYVLIGACYDTVDVDVGTRHLGCCRSGSHISTIVLLFLVACENLYRIGWLTVCMYGPVNWYLGKCSESAFPRLGCSLLIMCFSCLLCELEVRYQKVPGKSQKISTNKVGF